MTDWTGASWKFTESGLSGQPVTIIGKRNDPDFGEVWVGQIPDGREFIFTKGRLDEDLDPKTRKPKVRHACA